MFRYFFQVRTVSRFSIPNRRFQQLFLADPAIFVRNLFDGGNFNTLPVFNDLDKLGVGTVRETLMELEFRSDRLQFQ